MTTSKPASYRPRTDFDRLCADALWEKTPMAERTTLDDGRRAVLVRRGGELFWAPIYLFRFTDTGAA